MLMHIILALTMYQAFVQLPPPQKKIPIHCKLVKFMALFSFPILSDDLNE